MWHTQFSNALQQLFEFIKWNLKLFPMNQVHSTIEFRLSSEHFKLNFLWKIFEIEQLNFPFSSNKLKYHIKYETDKHRIDMEPIRTIDWYSFSGTANGIIAHRCCYTADGSANRKRFRKLWCYINTSTYNLDRVHFSKRFDAFDEHLYFIRRFAFYLLWLFALTLYVCIFVERKNMFLIAIEIGSVRNGMKERIDTVYYRVTYDEFMSWNRLCIAFIAHKPFSPLFFHSGLIGIVGIVGCSLHYLNWKSTHMWECATHDETHVNI